MPPQTQAVKDAFYLTLRDRIAANNPNRTLVLRGQIRPAVLVAENELPAASTQPDTFTLHWPMLTYTPDGLTQLRCEIHYATSGSQAASGMDRGRALAALDQELLTALNATPRNTGTSPHIFWADPIFSPATENAERMERSATVEVFRYAG